MNLKSIGRLESGSSFAFLIKNFTDAILKRDVIIPGSRKGRGAQHVSDLMVSSPAAMTVSCNERAEQRDRNLPGR
jgi:hypothetical protein